MRVLLDVSAVPAQPVGAGVYTVELARHLAPAVDLVLLTRRNDGSRWVSIAPRATVAAAAPDARPTRLLWEQRTGPRIADRYQPDCWHGPHYTMPLRMRRPSLVTFHDTTLIEQPAWHQTSKVVFFRRMMRAVANRANVIVAVSDYTAARVHALLNPPCPVVTIPHGVDHDNFRPGTFGDSNELERLAAWDIRPPYIAFTGTHEPRKNIPGLIRAFTRIATAHRDTTLVLAGPAGWGSKDIARELEASHVRTRILTPGRLPYDVLPAFFRQAEVVCYPSFEEGFGLPALETLASGGVLLSTSGSAVETFVDDAALLVRPHDDAALTETLDDLLNDAATRSRLRERGPLVAAPFTWERSAKAHIEAYAQALEQHT